MVEQAKFAQANAEQKLKTANQTVRIADKRRNLSHYSIV